MFKTLPNKLFHSFFFWITLAGFTLVAEVRYLNSLQTHTTEVHLWAILWSFVAVCLVITSLCVQSPEEVEEVARKLEKKIVED
ncbi:hypothetical protein H6781_02610 [Candidatus Nomurabacteria bacterium]|nr:hypothetical protein [Candidatus Kaiserbacteria bacterium]MCB9810461.1 hypothetical protein [Candidatus Nomurabacteria bacterium]MCB9818210.1 hypothetical protein [Candidatus Nomurabacteria bacterium]